MFARRLEGAEPCEDTDADCERLTLAGECTANPVWMAIHCAKSCDTCRGVKLPAASTLASSTWAECTDSHKSCERWARDGECESNPGFMKASCRASCAECESSKCHDKDSGCPKWAANGECRTNSDFMLQTCTYSCGVCGINFKPECRRDPAMKPSGVKGTIDVSFQEALDRFQHLRPRIIRREPWIVQFDEFLKPWEADHLVKTGGHNFERSLAGDGVTPVRTSSTSWCNVPSCLGDTLFQSIRERIVNVTKVPWQYSEHLQVLKYNVGQFYHDHHDQNSPRHSAWGPRLYTFFMYLSDVEAGGETRFTRLNISVTPKKGSAIWWPSVYSDDPFKTDERTYHEAVAVEKGVKYAANFWLHMYEFQETLQRGCDNSDYFQDSLLGEKEKLIRAHVPAGSHRV